MDQRNLQFTLLISIVLSGAAGCGGGSSSEAPVNTGNTITPDADGWVMGNTNAVGIQGTWYGYVDSIGADGMPPGDCQKNGHSEAQCSVLIAPRANTFPNNGGVMCTEGKVAPATVNGVADWGHIWGGGIAFQFNGEKDVVGSKPFDAVAKGITGLSFDLDVVPDAFRVEFPTATTAGGGSNYWGATPEYPNSPAVVGTNVLKWGEVASPSPANVKPFSPSEVLRVEFHVPAASMDARPYKFCVSNLKVITE